MFARNVSIHLKSNMLSDYARAFDEGKSRNMDACFHGENKCFSIALKRFLWAAKLGCTVVMGLWFMAMTASAQIRTFTEWTIPNSQLLTHVARQGTSTIYFVGGKGNLNKIGKVDLTTNTVTQWVLPTNSVPHYVTLSKLGVAFTALGTSYIAILNPTTSVFEQWQIPGLSPAHLTLSGNSIFFTETNTDRIGMLNMSDNSITEWQVPTKNDVPWGMAQNVSTQVFFVESVSNKIGMLDISTNSISEWAVPGVVQIQHIHFNGGLVYFGDSGSSILGNLDPTTNVITEWTAPTTDARVLDLGVSSGMVWFTEFGTNKIGLLNTKDQTGVPTTVSPVVTVVNPTPGPVPVIDIAKLNTHSSVVTPTIKPVDGVVSNGVTEWTVPTASSGPVGMTLSGTAVLFAEHNVTKVGMLK